MLNQEPNRKLAAAVNSADGVGLFGPTPESASRRQDGVLRRCAWCQRIPVGLDVWVKEEEALQILPFLSPEMLAEATHGVCPECFYSFLNGPDLMNKPKELPSFSPGLPAFV
jgi:hypothetical protein